MNINRRRRRGSFELNSTSTSDISFTLLIFFLVTTSMNTDKGLGRKLPPIVPTELQRENLVNKDMVLTLHLQKDGKLNIDDKPTGIDADLRKRLRHFILEKGPTHIIELQTDRDADYNSYFQLQNQITRTYAELRAAAAQKLYGSTITRCNEEQRARLLQMYPQRVQEVVAY